MLFGAAGRIRTADLILTNSIQPVFTCWWLLSPVAPQPFYIKGYGAFCVVFYRCLLCLEKCCFLMPVWVLYGFLVKPIPRDLIPYLQLF